MPREALHGWHYSLEHYRLVVASGTSAEEYVTDLTPGYRRELVAGWMVASGDGAGAGGSRLIRVLKNTATVALSRTVLLADTGTKGRVTAFTLSTTPSDCQWFDDDELSIDVTAAGTQFTTLTFTLWLKWRQHHQQ